MHFRKKKGHTLPFRTPENLSIRMEFTGNFRKITYTFIPIAQHIQLACTNESGCDGRCELSKIVQQTFDDDNNIDADSKYSQRFFFFRCDFALIIARNWRKMFSQRHEYHHFCHSLLVIMHNQQQIMWHEICLNMYSYVSLAE